VRAQIARPQAVSGRQRGPGGEKTAKASDARPWRRGPPHRRSRSARLRLTRGDAISSPGSPRFHPAHARGRAGSRPSLHISKAVGFIQDAGNAPLFPRWQISDEKNDWAFWGWVVRLYRKGPTPTSPLSARLARVWQGVAAREQSIRSVGGGRSVRPGWQACGGVRSRRCWVAALPRRRPAVSAGTPPLQIGC
jgi:hypothetical protein